MSNQLNEVSNWAALESVFQNLKSRMDKSIITCRKCKNTLHVQVFILWIWII